MKRIMKYYLFIITLIMLLTLSSAAFITAGERSAQITKGVETKKYKLTDEINTDELESLIYSFTSFLPFRG